MLQLEESGKKKDREKALQELRAYHEWLRSLHFLDPACGSGNFLYVTLAAVKRIELEVLNEIQRLSDGQGGLVLDEVHPRQFHGIEIKPWAREIAELTLWIGYHQFWRDTHGGRTPPTPILEDTGTLECRDAVLAWDAIVHRPEKDRPDPTPRIKHPVTGELVPDPEAKLPYYEYVGARAAEWPRADFIVGNPPYMGWKYQREALGDGYVDALRAIYRNLPDSADLVMYWWARAATAVAKGRVVRAGLITTNSITQQQNREVAEQLLGDDAAIAWAIADHPWIAESDGAAVRIAMTVTARPSARPRLLRYDSLSGKLNDLQSEFTGSDLTLGIVATTSDLESLRSNQGLAHVGFQLNGRGFVLAADEAEQLLASMPDAPIRPLLSGRDISAVSRKLFVIDFGLMDESAARAWPVLFDIVRARVKPERDANARASRRIGWWKFGEPNPSLRAATAGTNRVITTSLTARHRSFQFVDSRVAFDSTVVGIASDDAAWLGVLSSSIHNAWAESVGSRLGVGNDYRYTKGTCFEAFPFPTPPNDLRTRIAALAERLDTHRKDALARDERITMTGMYNVVEKLRSGEALTPKERAIHELAACGVLRDLHDALDALVAQAYGWPWPLSREEILERLVALHDERVAEEARGLVRWLRPEYQIPRFARDSAGVAPALELAEARATSAALEARPEAVSAWPASAVEQLAVLGTLVSQRPATVDEAVAAFAGARRELVARHLETLALMGEVSVDAEERYGAVARSP